MNAKEQTLVDRTVDNYHGMDDLKAESKDAIDVMFVKMSEFVDKNYDAFVKDPELVIAQFINDYMTDNLKLIERATKLGVELGEAINEV